MGIRLLDTIGQLSLEKDSRTYLDFESACFFFYLSSSDKQPSPHKYESWETLTLLRRWETVSIAERNKLNAYCAPQWKELSRCFLMEYLKWQEEP